MNWRIPLMAAAFMAATGTAWGDESEPLRLSLPQDDVSPVVIRAAAAPLGEAGESSVALPHGLSLGLRWSDEDTEWRGLVMHMRVGDSTKVMVRFAGRIFIGARHDW